MTAVSSDAPSPITSVSGDTAREIGSPSVVTRKASAVGDIAEIIGRLEKASEPSWELDIEIGELVFPDQYKTLCEDFEKTWKRAQENGLHDRRLACWRSTFQGVWRFTYSIDAALTLVPDGYGWRCDGPKTFWTIVGLHTEKGNFTRAKPNGISFGAPNAAIALCIAALRAREKQ